MIDLDEREVKNYAHLFVVYKNLLFLYNGIKLHEHLGR